jgi:hypothetical protein
MRRRPASTSAPWTSSSGSATSPAWPAATGSSASSPSTGGDYEEAARQYQRALDIFEQLGDQPGMATSYHQLGNLEADRNGPATAVIAWHVKALTIRLQLGIPQAIYDMRRLSAHRHEIGGESFTRSLLQATGDADLAKTITSLLDQADSADDGAA